MFSCKKNAYKVSPNDVMKFKFRKYSESIFYVSWTVKNKSKLNEKYWEEKSDKIFLTKYWPYKVTLLLVIRIKKSAKTLIKINSST